LQTNRKSPAVVYAGQNISEDYLYELQELLKTKKFGIISISKSGTTTEPALAFRLLRTQLEQQQGKADAQKLIVTVTDKARGALRTLAVQEGYKTYVLEDDIGGRYSVLSPVGLLPIAVAGFDIRKLVQGAVSMEQLCGVNTPFEDNPAAQYAAVRNELYKSGKKLKFWSTIILNCILFQNGGNNFTAKVKGKTMWVFSLLPLISQPTYTPWGNGYKRVKEPFLRLSFQFRKATTPYWFRRMQPI
jgi:glucose-6-phosphate isomerase